MIEEDTFFYRGLLRRYSYFFIEWFFLKIIGSQMVYRRSNGGWRFSLIRKHFSKKGTKESFFFFLVVWEIDVELGPEDTC